MEDNRGKRNLADISVIDRQSLKRQARRVGIPVRSSLLFPALTSALAQAGDQRHVLEASSDRTNAASVRDFTTYPSCWARRNVWKALLNTYLLVQWLMLSASTRPSPQGHCRCSTRIQLLIMACLYPGALLVPKTPLCASLWQGGMSRC